MRLDWQVASKRRPLESVASFHFVCPSLCSLATREEGPRQHSSAVHFGAGNQSFRSHTVLPHAADLSYSGRRSAIRRSRRAMPRAKLSG